MKSKKKSLSCETPGVPVSQRDRIIFSTRANYLYEQHTYYTLCELKEQYFFSIPVLRTKSRNENNANIPLSTSESSRAFLEERPCDILMHKSKPF
jgi:hypothetical protein